MRRLITTGGFSVLVSFLSFCFGATVSAAPCPFVGVEVGPLLLGGGAAELGGADFGEIGEVCPGTDVSVRTRAALAIDRPDYYGGVAAAGTLRIRFQFAERWVASAAVDAAVWRFTANAVVESSRLDSGPPTLGAGRALLLGPTTVAAFARLLLPFDSARQQGVLWGLELGGAAVHRLRPRWVLQGGLTLPATLALVSETAHGVLRPAALVEASHRIRPWLALAAGLSARTEAGPHPALRALAPRASIRFATVGGWFLALGGEAPLAGRDRTDAAAALLVGHSHARVSP